MLVTRWIPLFLSLIVILFLGAVPAMSETATEHKYTNHLEGETSPYLLQHVHNAVEWYPWGEEAHSRAKKENKPIFLSIGYAACHWCHVMEHESFENERVADLLEKYFVSIKVDREERPDLDEIYMTATQMLTGSGGWPMSVFLTPDLEPFYAGTYFPLRGNYGRPGFLELVERLGKAYQEQPETVFKSAKEISSNLKRFLATDAKSATVTADLTAKTALQFTQRYDPLWGGFGGAPKFPHTMDLMLLLRQQRRNQDPKLLEMVTHSLDMMSRGGMYDQAGGGFHRYSVDEKWLIPHFEKMLYDNALLAKTYLEAYQVTGDERFAKIARETLDYVVREMQSPEGGYYSSTDADSEGEEGKFFVWSPEEIAEVIGEEDAKVVCEYFDVRKDGNFEHSGKSALWIPAEPTDVAAKLGISEDQLSEIIERSKKKLYEKRSTRIPPLLDDKVLTDWNGLMISAMAFGAYVLDESRYLDSANRAADVLLEHQWNEKRLLHTRREGKSHLNGMLADYSYLVMGLVDLYLASLDIARLEAAKAIHSRMVDLFADKEDGGYYNTLAGLSDLILRTKTASDGAQPSGNSIAAYNSARLGNLLGDPKLTREAERTVLAFGADLERSAVGHPQMAIAWDYLQNEGEEIVLVPGSSGGVDEFLDPLRKRFSPYLVWLSADGEKTAAVAPPASGKKALDGKTTAYLCRGSTCQAPTTDVGALLSELK